MWGRRRIQGLSIFTPPKRQQPIHHGLQVGIALAAFGKIGIAAALGPGSGLHKHQMGTQSLARLQMLDTATNGPDLMAFRTVAIGNLFEQRYAGFAALAVFIGSMGAKKHGFHARADSGHLPVHLGMHGIELDHIEQSAAQSRLIGGNHHMPAGTVQTRNRLQCTGDCNPFIGPSNEALGTPLVQGAITVKNCDLHGI